MIINNSLCNNVINKKNNSRYYNYYVTPFGKRDFFDKNIILINKQLKIYKTIEKKNASYFDGIIDTNLPCLMQT